MPSFRCRAILFDLDGVLVNSVPAIVQVWSRWGDENGISRGLVLKTIHGRRTGEVLQLLAPHLDITEHVREIEHEITEATKHAPAIPGAARLIASIPNGRWCVVTSGVYDLAAGRLRAAGLPVPRVLVSAEDVTKGKPDPEPYLKGAERLGFTPRDCLVVEDAVLGIQAAHAAGMPAVALASTHERAELTAADAVVDSLVSVRVSDVGPSEMDVTVE